MPKPDNTVQEATIDVQFSTYISTNRGLIRDIEYDSSGNIYVTGGAPQIASAIITPGNDYFDPSGTVDHGRFDPHDVFVQKYSATGELIWTTRIGGVNYDRAYALEVDDQGGVYVAGRAGNDFYTTTGALQETFGGDSEATQNPPYGPQDGFVSKLDAATGQLDWSTYLGGASGEFIRDIDVSPDGTIHVAQTFVKTEAGQHITADAMQPGFSGTVSDIYAQLSNDGSTLLYGTYIGGPTQNVSSPNPSIIVDGNGDINIVMQTDADGAPTTAGAYSSQLIGTDDLYLVKLDGSDGGRSIKAATYFGTSGSEILETHDLAVDAEGNFIVIGETTGSDLETNSQSFQQNDAGGTTDGFVAKISSDGTQVLAATYFGGNGRDNLEGIVLKDDGIYVTGKTSSTDLPVTDTSTFGGFSGVEDSFFVRFTTDLQNVDYASYLGGSDVDHGRAIAVSDSGQVTVGGISKSADFPTVNAEDGTIWNPSSPTLTSFVISPGDTGGGGKGGGKGGGGNGGGGGGNGGGGGKGGGKPAKSTTEDSSAARSDAADAFSFAPSQGFTQAMASAGANAYAVQQATAHNESSIFSAIDDALSSLKVLQDDDGDGVLSLNADDLWGLS